jgi:hypothetical protein
MPVRKILRTLGIALVAAIGVAILAVPAGATFTTPNSNPFTVPADGSGNPVPFDVTVSGFAPHALVYLEICDGVSPSSPGYDAADHCDPGSEGPAPTADNNGVATFPAASQFHVAPFKGLSPSQSFYCLAPNDPNGDNSFGPSWGNTGVNPQHLSCQLRATTNPSSSASGDQFISLILPAGSGPVTPEVPYAVILPIAGVAVAGAFFIIRKRRASPHAA